MATVSSLGTNFGDGVRVGPGLGILNKGQGSQLAPISVYDIAPAAANNQNIVLPVTTVGAGYLTLAAGTGTTQVSKFGLTNVIEFDVPRTYAAFLSGGVTVGVLTVTGYDMYFNLMQDQVTTTPGQTAYGQKAFKWVTSAYYSNIVDPGNTLSVGTSNIFGLPWRVDYGNYIFAKFGDSVIPTPISGLTTLIGGTINIPMINVPFDSIAIATTHVPQGTQGILSCAITVNGNGYNQLTITSSQEEDTSSVFYTVSSPSAQVLFTEAYQTLGPDGNPEPCTATTPDVRGTVSVLDLITKPNGMNRLTVFAYVLGSNTTALIDPTIQALDEYAYKTIPNVDTLQGYPQFSGT